MAMEVTERIFVTTMLCAVVAFIMYWSKRWRLYWKCMKFPGPYGVPILGSSIYFLGDTTKIMPKLLKLTTIYPSAFKMWLGELAIFTLYDPDQMKVVLYSPKAIEKMDVYRFAYPWLGQGLVTGRAAIWKVHRKIISPTFHQQILDSFVRVFAKQAKIMTEQMKKELKGNEFKIFSYVEACTLDIICETSMGIPLNTQTQQNMPYRNAAKLILKLWMSRTFNALLHPEWIFKHTKLAEKQTECLKHLNEVTDRVLREKITTRENALNLPESQDTLGKAKGRKVFLDLLLESSENGVQLTENEIRDEVNTMIMTGSDTTATISTFALLMLAMHPDIQEKAFQELREIYGDEVYTDALIKSSDLPRMEYLERILKETMRLFPVAPFLARQTTEDIDIGDCTLPKGCNVILAVLKVQRWEKYWPDPLKFDPDRFLPEEVLKRHPCCYLPYSIGPRNCVGIKYGVMSMKVLLATMLRSYVVKTERVRKVEDVKIVGHFLLEPAEPIMLKIEKRCKV